MISGKCFLKLNIIIDYKYISKKILYSSGVTLICNLLLLTVFLSFLNAHYITLDFPLKITFGEHFSPSPHSSTCKIEEILLT